jgi:ABC-2 type transport system permease protein
LKLLALITDTFREIYAKKVILGIIGIEVIALVITGFVLFSDGMQTTYREAVKSGNVINEATSNGERESRFNEDDSVLTELGEAGALDSLGPRDTAGAPAGKSSKTFETPPNVPGNTTLPINGEVMLQEMVKGQMAAFAALIVGAVLFLGIFATAGIVPSMMEKGTVDLLLSKPLPRSVLLFGRALGGIAAIAINVTLFALAIYVVYGMASGVWYFPFVTLTVGISLFAFLVLYSMVILLNVLTESWVLPMSLAWIHMMILSTFLTNREETLYTFIGSPVIRGIIDGLYYLLPQVNDLIIALPAAIFSSVGVPSAPLIQCTIFTLVMLGLAAWRFEKKDF